MSNVEPIPLELRITDKGPGLNSQSNDGKQVRELTTASGRFPSACGTRGRWMSPVLNECSWQVGGQTSELALEPNDATRILYIVGKMRVRRAN